MNASKSIFTGLLSTASAAASGLAAPPDVWLTTRAKMALLTADGIRFTGVDVETGER
jgi:hypothetical protein